ncbi:glutathione-regulated potassium-efflux system oxidoreductase KefF [Entomohabitans teleogrylli]|uniref:glutathione-regulated potassium-efflux system oxidoreductase KefF n=1 Tax=Entomohabitans teleogrylli TaxID=1384589 RepID=UPI00073D88D1|nr:glutathione-regulated potassium-efflux system oxidoreductase KefF [Entomohabitans teleogrylli]
MILIIYAHPYPQHSHANRRMLEQISALPDVEVRSLYQLYPDFNINIAAEQAAVSRASLVVWQHPMQWYSIPPLLKLWIDKVLSHGWAYGHGGNALHGKSLLWAVTTGGSEHHFDIGDYPGFEVLAQPLQATAVYCGMTWLPPFAMHCTFVCDDETLSAHARRYKQCLMNWLEEEQHGQS